jgi:hypothetical protein
MRDVKVTLGVGIALMVVVGALTLTHSPPRVVRVGTRTTNAGPYVTGDAEFCQANEVLPAGVSAIRLSLGAFYGSRVRVKVSSGPLVLAEGRRGADWTGRSVTVPVASLNHSTLHVKLCVAVGPNSEPISVEGIIVSAREMAVWRAGPQAGELLGGRVGVEYLAAGQGSWWSRILPVARHMGIGHALSGTWVALLIVAIVAAVGLLAVRLVLRELP